MTTPIRTSGALPNARRTRQRWRVAMIGMVVLIFALVIVSVAFVGRNAPGAGADIAVSSHPAPPNAEPQGRAWGPLDAPIRVVEFADYECESCGYWAKNYEQDFVERYAPTDKVRFEVRFAPFHGEGAQNAAQGAYCAADQNRFWSFHDSLFLNQPAHGAAASAGFSVERLKAIAARLDMDATAFGSCLESGKYRQQVLDDLAGAQAAGITGTPTFVIGERAYEGPIATEDFAGIFAEVAPDVSLD